jgi:hypothetical protein
MRVDRNGLALAFAALLCTGCAANREGARALADAGIGATSALSIEIDRRAERVERKIAGQNFNYAYSSMRNCGSGQGTAITLADGPEPVCDVIATAEARASAAVPQRLASLAEIMRLRARAIQKLGAAYRALGTEADYKAREELEGAINAATASASQLGTALGIGAVPQAVAGGVALIGGQLAEGAQQRRLVRGSERLQAVTSHLRRSLEREQALLEEVDMLAGDIESETRRHLTTAGLLPAAPMLKEVVRSSDFPPPDDRSIEAALAGNPRLRAASQVAALAARPARSDAALAAAIELLGALEAEHAKFQARRRVSVNEVSSLVDRLTGIVAADDERSAQPDDSTDAEGN